MKLIQSRIVHWDMDGDSCGIFLDEHGCLWGAIFKLEPTCLSCWFRREDGFNYFLGHWPSWEQAKSIVEQALGAIP